MESTRQVSVVVSMAISFITLTWLDYSEAIGTQLPREQSATNYRSKLKVRVSLFMLQQLIPDIELLPAQERFQHAPDVRKIAQHRHVPKHILTVFSSLL